MEKINKKAGIYILNYNGIYWLKRNLKNLIKYSPNIPITIIDNNSSDESIQYIENTFPIIDIQKNKENYGFAKGYNQVLLQNTKLDFFIIINNDIQVTKDWTQPLLKKINDKNVGIIQPKIKALSRLKNKSYKTTNHFDYAGAAGGFIDKLGFPFCRGRILQYTEEDTGQYNDDSEIFWAAGCCFIIERKLFHQLNGFDEDLFMHQEEVDLCWRAQALKKQVYFCSKSTVYHANGGTLGTHDPIKKFYNHRNNLLVLIKNHPFPLFIVFIRILIDYLIIIIYFFNLIYYLTTYLIHRNQSSTFIFAKYIYQILRAHTSLIFLFPKFFNKRQAIKTRNKYSGIILFDYFIRGIREFSKLK